MTNQWVSIVQPGIIGDLKSYWAMHFCAILEALRQQKQLKYSFQKSIPEGLVVSLGSLVANTPLSFFGQLKGSINNFGLQYFLCYYLASNEGRPAVIALLNGIANAYNQPLPEELKSFRIFVCGIDSYSGQAFLQSTDAQIFGYNEHTIQNVWRDINFVDLCILLERAVYPYRIAILGEVEGNNGARLTRESFWGAKSSFCSFGVGVVKNGRAQMEISTFQTTVGLKTILTLSSNFAIVEDFKVAIDTLEVLFSLGPHINIPLHDGMRSVVEMIRYHWNNPVDDLISELRAMIVVFDSAALGKDIISMPSIPKIIQ